MSEIRNPLVTRSPKRSKYAVVKKSIVAKPLHRNVNNSEQRAILLGSLVEIQSVVPCEDSVVVRVKSDSKWDRLGDNDWLVKWDNHTPPLIPVFPALWPAFQGISSPFQRVNMAEEEKLCNELAKIQVGDMVYLLPETVENVNVCDIEVSIVRYKGPVQEIGPGHYFGLELLANSTEGRCDGSISGTRYFTCQESCGVFVPLNRLRPYRQTKSVSVHNIFSEPLKYSEVFDKPNTSISRCSPMPSNEKRIQQHNGGVSDTVNYTTTLVLHLKEKDNMPRNQMQKVERTEKLIDLEPTCNNSDVKNSPLKPGDEVVWFDGPETETGVVRWIGRGNDKNEIMVDVECDNATGGGTGEHNHYKPTRKERLPLTSLVKADDFYPKPTDHMKKKARNIKLIENCNSKGSRTQANTRSSDSYSESAIRNTPLVDFNDVSDNVANNSFSKEKREDNVCRSEYVFSESCVEPPSHKLDNVNRRVGKDSRNNNNSVRKTCSNLSNYPLGEASPRDHVLNESPLNRHVNDRISKNNNETKIRHSYSQDLHPRNGLDTSDSLDDSWPPVNENSHSKFRNREDKRSRAVGPNGKSTKLNNSTEPLLEIVGEGLLHVPDQTKSVEVHDHLLSTSPSVSSDGSGYYENPDSPEHTLPSDLGIGSVVEVRIKNVPRYGVIRWIGVVPEDKKKGRKVAGIEMEEEYPGCTDGTFNGRRYFQCNAKKALFVSLSQCQKDGRFQDVQPSTSDAKLKSFGQMSCPVIPGVVHPISWKDDTEVVCGKFRGIQGHHNSCYLDATLFSMFTFTSAFDSLLFRPPMENDVSQYEEVQRVLREEIVNPLRQNLYVRADRVMKLRTLLENLSSVTGLTSEEKDPEEFLTSLVAQILRAEPFLKLSSGQEAYHYQLFVEKDEQLILPSVQQLFDQSFLTSDIKLNEVPSCLIIQMPRFGKSFKMYPRILPSQLLDVTDIIEDSPRQCTVCGKLAEFECKECFGECGIGLESTAFCGECLDTAHSHQRRNSHNWRRLSVPVEFSILQDHCHISRLYMELFAVVCIETSHYVAFVKCGSGLDAPWCFFDSMADRKGEQNGYNIPEMVLCPKLPYWLSDEGSRSLQEIKDDRLLPEHAKRLLCDAYMCMYQSPDVMMYR